LKIMSCDENQQRILDQDWDESSLREAAELFAHIRECETCRQALQGHSALRGLLLQDGLATPIGGWQRFEDDLLQQVATMTQASSTPRPVSSTNFSLAMVAASLLLAMVGWAFYFHADGHPESSVVQNTGTQSQARLAWSGEAFRLTAKEIKNGMALFRKVSEVADGQVGWVAVASNTAELGVSTEPLPPQEKVFLLRLVLSRGDDKAPVDTNLVMVPGQTAVMTLPLEGGKHIRYRIKANENRGHEVSLVAKVQDAAHPQQAAAILATHLSPANGEVIRAGTLQTSDGCYELAMAFADHQLQGVQP
jgi:hypothetical protein